MYVGYTRVRADKKINIYDKLLQSGLALQEFWILMVNRIEIWDIVFNESNNRPLTRYYSVQEIYRKWLGEYER
ncbi:hypothetical protein PIPA1_10170 [Pelosinus sp. IPA-1]|nr:hypothetical protein PIPA1_10170 [Pelosinus sp. IPA-1]